MLVLDVVKSENGGLRLRKEVLELCANAYGEDLEGYLDDIGTGTHVVAYLDHILVSHAMWVDRTLTVDEDRVLSAAYVELVATHPDYRKRGFATGVMRRLAGEILGYDIGALSPGETHLYAHLGWQLWEGPLFVETATGFVRSPEEESVMILQLPNTPKIDLKASLTAEWRAGEVW